MSCLLCWGGFWWCNCLWITFASISNSSPIFLKVTTINKFIDLPSWILVVSIIYLGWVDVYVTSHQETFCHTTTWPDTKDSATCLTYETCLSEPKPQINFPALSWWISVWLGRMNGKVHLPFREEDSCSSFCPSTAVSVGDLSFTLGITFAFQVSDFRCR